MQRFNVLVLGNEIWLQDTSYILIHGNHASRCPTSATAVDVLSKTEFMTTNEKVQRRTTYKYEQREDTTGSKMD